MNSFPGDFTIAERPAHPVRWVDLLVRPDRFFPGGADRLRTSLLWILVLLLGAAGTMDRLDMNFLRSAMRGNELDVLKNWESYWIVVSSGSIVMGPIIYFVAGWWYGARLRFAGAAVVDSDRARRIALLTSSIITVPAVAAVLFDTVRFATPESTWSGTGPIATSLLITPFFSVFVSHRAARSSFDLRPRPALWWFAILPAASYASIYVFGALVAANAIG